MAHLKTATFIVRQILFFTLYSRQYYGLDHNLFIGFRVVRRAARNYAIFGRQ